MGLVKLSKRSGDLGESIREAGEFARDRRAVGFSAIHAQEMAGGGEGTDQGGQALDRRRQGDGQWRHHITIRHVLAGQVILLLQITLDDQGITQGHADVFVAQEFFQGHKINPETQHLGRI